MITRNFKLFLSAGKQIPLMINVSQYDHGEKWVFTLYDDHGQKYTPSTGAIVGIKADKKGIINTGTVNSAGQVEIMETQQMTAAAGKAVFELLIDGDTHGTANFIVLVEPKPGDQADMSASDLSLLQQAINSIAIAGSGAPAVATLAADMTDEGKIYLYAGSEVGYTAGDWYYYNGASWVDGGKYGGTVDATLTQPGQAADAKKVGDEISDLKSQIAQGMPREVKLAMDAMFANMAVENDDVYSDEYAVFHAWATAINLESISAVFTQGANVVYDTDSLDSLKQYLVVTATYDDESTATVTTYTLSGSLDPGTSTITVSYDGKSTTFDVTVTERIDFTPSTYVVGTYGATAEGFTYDSSSTKRLVENPIGITGLKNGCTYKASLNGNTTVGYGIGMYTFATVNPDDINRTVVEGTSKTISTDAMSYTALGHTAWASDDCTFTWTGDEKSLLLVNFRNSGNTAITSANKTAVKNNFTLTKVTGE